MAIPVLAQSQMVNETGFCPVGQYLLMRFDPDAVQEGGIWLPEVGQQLGWCADVLQAGDDCAIVGYGDRVMFRKPNTVRPFVDRRLAVTTEDALFALLEGKRDEEDIMPLGRYILMIPEPIQDEIDGVALPDGHRRWPNFGTVMRIGPKCQHGYKIGQKLIYDQYMRMSVYERSTALQLIHEKDVKAIITGGKKMNVEPVLDLVAVKRDSAETRKGLIYLADVSIKEPPQGVVIAKGPDVKAKIEVGDRVLLVNQEGFKWRTGQTEEIQILKEEFILGKLQ